MSKVCGGMSKLCLESLDVASVRITSYRCVGLPLEELADVTESSLASSSWIVPMDRAGRHEAAQRTDRRPTEPCAFD